MDRSPAEVVATLLDGGLPVQCIVFWPPRCRFRNAGRSALEGSERESRGTVRCGMGETIHDALATRCTVPVSLEDLTHCDIQEPRPLGPTS